MTETDILRQELLEKGWTYATLAKRFNCSPAHVSAVLRGKRVSYTLLALLRDMPPYAAIAKENR